MSDSIKSQSEMRTKWTDEMREAYDRTFGERDRRGERGRWVWDKRQNKLVRAEEYVAEDPEPTRVPVVTDRHHEGTVAPDGTDIGSRNKRREYMKRTGVADASDFKGTWQQANEAKQRIQKDGLDARQVREVTDTVGRKAYELSKKRRR